jgi:fluoride exporter
MKSLLLAGLGGSLGTMLRYIIQKWQPQHSLAVFPAGTFLVNISGCFLIGILSGFFMRNSLLHDDLKLFLMTGFCGGFTTFSAFTLEGIGLLKENKMGLFLFYTAGTVLFGLLATYSGFRLTR